MKTKLYSLFAFICILGNIATAQETYEWGAKFEFDPENEKDVKFAMVDNYNTFLTSYIDVYGMVAEHKLLVRKFDQKNQLIETYTTELPTFDKGAYYNYIGSADAGKDKVVFFSEAYVGKTKKKEISQTVFDKSTGKFTSMVIANIPIESAMKSGTTYFELSQNKRFAAIRHEKHSGRKDPQVNIITVIDLQNISTVWNKEYIFQDGFHAKSYGVSNTGNIVIVAADTATKLQDYLLLGSALGFEKKAFSTYMEVHKPTIFNIGQKEYLIAFNKEVKGIIKDPYENILLYDLESGNVIANNKAVGLYSHKDIVDVSIRNLFIENNEIIIFSEGKLKAGTKEQKSYGSTMTIPTAYYHFTPSYMIKLSLEGEIKQKVKLEISNNNQADLYHSFGVNLNKGKFYIKTSGYSGIIHLQINGSHTPVFYIDGGTDPNKTSQMKYINQLTHYLPDSNTFILTRTIDQNGMSLVSVKGANIK